MSIIRTARTAVLTIAAVAVAAAPAGATLHSPTDSYMTEPCKLDTSPSYPSCGTGFAGTGTTEAVAIKLGATSFTVTPCKLDTSPSYPSCGGQPR